MINLSDDMSAEDWQVISSKLYNYNLELSKGLSTKPGSKINLVLRNERGKIVGGIACRAFYQSLSIDHLWVDEKYRGTGYGKQLVLRAENLAKEAGCISSNTSSYSFQAPEFYKKLGYRIAGTFEGYPDGIKKFYFEKRLEK